MTHRQRIFISLCADFSILKLQDRMKVPEDLLKRNIIKTGLQPSQDKLGVWATGHSQHLGCGLPEQ